MTAHDQMIDALLTGYYRYDPDAVCYIVRYDGEGNKVKEIDGSYCHGCATTKSFELDRECGGMYYHEVCEESSPEDGCFMHCAECGCLLNAALVTQYLDEDDLDWVTEDLKGIKEWDAISGELKWRLYSILCDEETVKTQYPKKIASLTRRLTTLFKKSKEYKED